MNTIEFNSYVAKSILYYTDKKQWLKKLATSLLAEFVADNDVPRQQELLDLIHSVRDRIIAIAQHPDVLEYVSINGVPNIPELDEAKTIIGAIPRTLGQASNNNGKKKLQDLIDAYL